MNTGVFTISLDFELHWGVSDHRTVESYQENLKNVPAVVTGLLKLFEEKKIHATWATVGMLFCRNKAELFEQVAPADRPAYTNKALSNYAVAESAGENENTDPFHYANSLIKKIIQTPYQEMATHTFSHYYCLEPGQTPAQFYHDLEAARKIMLRDGATAESIVFSRNQYNDEYLAECRKAGIKSYRGNYPSWLYRAEAKSTEGMGKRVGRFLDSYFPLNGHRFVYPGMKDELLNIPGSCFLRPYNKKLSFMESWRVRRIKKEMEAAARKKAVYHLWWHPHNFGKNLKENFAVLNKILDHYARLQEKYGMRSLNMAEIHQEYLKTKKQ